MIISLKSFFDKFSQIFLLIFLIIGLFFSNTLPSLAHSPHDVIEQIELSPHYSQNQTLYIIVRGVLLKSTDGGISWQRLFQGLDNQVNLESLSIAKSNEQTLFISSKYDGIYKSLNGGISWQKINNGLKNLAIKKIDISPYSDQLVLAVGSKRELYKTEDGGKNWQLLFDDILVTTIDFSPQENKPIFIGDKKGNLYISQDKGQNWSILSNFNDVGAITDIHFSANYLQDNTFFIATEKKGIWKTINQGESFQAINQGLSDLYIKDIAETQSENGKIILFASTWNQGIFRSDNGGNTWKKESQGLTKEPQADEKKFNSPHFSEIRISNNFQEDKTLFLAGFDGLFKSTDGGKKWKQLDTLSTRIITSLSISPNYINDSTLAVGSYEGEAYLSNNNGLIWQSISNDLNVVSAVQKRDSNVSVEVEPPRFWNLFLSPNYSNDHTIFATLSYDFYRSSDGGKRWEKISLKPIPNTSLRGMFSLRSPNYKQDKTIYLISRYGGGIYKSIDGGKNFSVIGHLKKNVNDVSISPNFDLDQTLFVSSINGIFKSTNGGKNWTILTDKPELKSFNWLKVEISPNYSQDKLIFAGTTNGLFKSKDDGENWVKVNNQNQIKNQINFVDALAISPDFKNDQTLFLTLRGQGTFKSVDGGNNFTLVKNLQEQNYSLSHLQTVWSSSPAIQFSPNYSEDKTIYGIGGFAGGIIQSKDSGETWNLINIPEPRNSFNLPLQLKIIKLHYKLKIWLRVITAIFLALMVYFLIDLLKLYKKLPLSRMEIKLASSLLSFVIIMALFSISF